MFALHNCFGGGNHGICNALLVYPSRSTLADIALQVRHHLQIPAPKVLAYNTQASTNGIGAEYILMEKCSGVELGRVWDSLSGRQRIEIVRQLATFSVRLAKARFPSYGALYFGKDLPGSQGTKIDDTFSVGPITSRSWFDDKRGEVDVDLGPCMSSAYQSVRRCG